EVFGPHGLHVVAQAALADGVEQPHHISVRRVVVHQSSSGTVNPAASSATRARRRYRSRSAARSRSQVDLATPENPSGRVSSRSLMQLARAAASTCFVVSVYIQPPKLSVCKHLVSLAATRPVQSLQSSHVFYGVDLATPSQPPRR